MQTLIKYSEPLDDLIVLRAESLRAMAWCTGAVGYLWLALIFWPITGGTASVTVWMGALLLLLSAAVALLLNQPYPHHARRLFVVGTFGTTVCTVLALHVPEAAYL
ncbi:MAG: hypothetical protein KDE31_00315 [Caldilineaceae bacterium]|nr:hypothetical protein [Caldilineaceae bacterium]